MPPVSPLPTLLDSAALGPFISYFFQKFNFLGRYHPLYDRLDEMLTDMDGDFELNATILSKWVTYGVAEEEFQNFEVELQIFHCNDDIRVS